MIYAPRSILWYHFVMIEYKKFCCKICSRTFFYNIFEENISQAKPISHGERRISQICVANLYHCGVCISLCAPHESGAALAM